MRGSGRRRVTPSELHVTLLRPDATTNASCNTFNAFRARLQPAKLYQKRQKAEGTEECTEIGNTSRKTQQKLIIVAGN